MLYYLLYLLFTLIAGIVSQQNVFVGFSLLLIYLFYLYYRRKENVRQSLLKTFLYAGVILICFFSSSMHSTESVGELPPNGDYQVVDFSYADGELNYLFVEDKQGRAFRFYPKEDKGFILGENIWIQWEQYRDYHVTYPSFYGARVLNTGHLVCGHGTGSLTKYDFASQSMLVRSKGKLIEKVTRGLPKKSADLSLVLLTGNRHYLSDVTYEMFRDAGLAHILAVSGLHIGIIFWVIFKGLSVIIDKRRWQMVISLLFCWLFGLFIGFPPSVFRALCWLTIPFIFELLKKPWYKDEAFLISIILMLLYRPFWLYHVGFMLSVLAFAAIIFLAPRWKKILSVSDNQVIRNYLVTYGSVQLMVLPIQLFYFKSWSLWGVLFNAIMVPIYSVILPLLLMFLLLPGVFSLVIGKFLHFLMMGQFFFLDFFPIEDNSLLLSFTGLSEILIYYALLWFLFWAIIDVRKKRIWFLTIVLLALHLAFELIVPTSYGFAIHFIDVGQGDATMVQQRDRAIFIDTGGHRYKNVYQDILKPYIKDYGVKLVDILMITHWDLDHSGEAKQFISDYQPQYILAPNFRTKDYGFSETLNQQVTLTSRGDVICWENVDFEILWPPDEGGYDDNEGSLVVRLTYKDLSVLFTGDIEKSAEQILYSYGDIPSDIVHVPHHGSRFSDTRRLLEKTMAHHAIISVGEANAYQHPHREVLEVLNEWDVIVHRTDEVGHVVVYEEGNTFKMKSGDKSSKIEGKECTFILAYLLMLAWLFMMAEDLEESHGFYSIYKQNNNRSNEG